jgi:hypothetical protein
MQAKRRLGRQLTDAKDGDVSRECGDSEYE